MQDGSYGTGSAHRDDCLIDESMQDGSYGTGSAHSDFSWVGGESHGVLTDVCGAVIEGERWGFRRDCLPRLVNLVLLRSLSAAMSASLACRGWGGICCCRCWG